MLPTHCYRAVQCCRKIHESRVYSVQYLDRVISHDTAWEVPFAVRTLWLDVI